MRHILTSLMLLSALPAMADPSFWSRDWPATDFTKTTIDSWGELQIGGPPKDGIPSITGPDFIAASADYRLAPREPVITLEQPGQVARAYPVRYLMWHEIVNDTVGDVPVAVTFCPLCNSGIVFNRHTDAGVLEFGVSGLLRHSDMIMYDRTTESWWQQAIGEAVVGDLTGTTLTALPSWMESWQAFTQRNPEGLVMDQPALNRNYGTNPYVGYDGNQRPFLYAGDPPPHGIPSLARVVRVGDAAWPLTRLAEVGEVLEDDLTFTWSQGQASALDTGEIGQGREVGNVRVRDASGTDVPHDVMFAFAFDAFWPEGRWMLGN